jgi:hypothetical protein
MLKYLLPAAAICASLLLALAKLPFQAQSASTISYAVAGDGETIEIHNVAWQYTGTQVPGRPADERLLLRTTTHQKNFVGDIPEPGAMTLEAWPLGVDPKQKPLYSVKLEADSAHTLDNCLWVIDRGYVDVPMWSIHRLGDGRHLFDTHVDLVRFTVSRADGNPRYAGLDVPADDTPDARLKDPHVVAVLIYAAEDRVLRQALITHDKPADARQLRSFADETQQVAFIETPARRLKIAFSHNYPDAPATVEASVPLVKDDLDVSHAQLPPGMHIAQFRGQATKPPNANR